MGTERALNVVALQTLLMSGVRDYGREPAIQAHTHRILATAASLDYVLMLATDSAGTRIPADDAKRAIHEGFARAVDDALLVLRAIVRLDARDARTFTRDGIVAVRNAMEHEALADDERRFALIVLTNDASS